MVQMEQFNDESQIPLEGRLSGLREEDATGVQQYLVYLNARHLRLAFRIPTDWLSFNIENGRHATLWSLLKDNNPGVNMEQDDPVWQSEIFTLLNGTWVDPGGTGVDTTDQHRAFEVLKDDLERNPQFDPGLVISNGAVMSGNRRLAALKTLASEYPADERYRYFEAFIVPGGSTGISSLDLWKLEIRQQTGNERYQENYPPEDSLVKIKQGVEEFEAAGRTREEAMEAVAQEMGRTSKAIKDDLESLVQIDDYLIKIGKPGLYSAVKGDTEVFNVMTQVEQKIERSSLSRGDKGRLRTGLHNVIRNGKATHQIVRSVNRALGPVRQSATAAQGNPDAIKIIIDSAPDPSDLEAEPTTETNEVAQDVVSRFQNSIQVQDSTQTPFANADRAADTLKQVAQSIIASEVSLDRFDELKSKLTTSGINLQACYDNMDDLDQSNVSE